MKLLDKLKSKNFKIDDWLMNSISLPSHSSDLPMAPYFNFLKKKLRSLSGDLLEFGVYRGDSIISTSLLLKKIVIKKKIYGFDTFEGFARKKHKFDNNKIFHKLFKNNKINTKQYNWIKLRESAIKNKLMQNHEWKNTSFNFVQKRIKKFRLENDIILIKGDISQTIKKKFLKKKNFAGVYMDCNLYEPHVAALNFSWKLLNKGGAIFLDDYFSLKYPGARIAINEFCEKNNIKIHRVKNYPGDFERYYLKK